jgi:hypothetical protein
MLCPIVSDNDSQTQGFWRSKVPVAAYLYRAALLAFSYLCFGLYRNTILSTRSRLLDEQALWAPVSRRVQPCHPLAATQFRNVLAQLSSVHKSHTESHGCDGADAQNTTGVAFYLCSTPISCVRRALCSWVSRMYLHPRTRGNAPESMGHDCTHDGGVTEPPCRTFGWMPGTRGPGSGVQLKPLWERWMRGSCPRLHKSRGCHSPARCPHQSSVLHPPAVASLGSSAVLCSRPSCSDDDFGNPPSFLPDRVRVSGDVCCLLPDARGPRCPN